MTENNQEQTEKPFALAIGYKSQNKHGCDKEPVITRFYATPNQVISAAYATSREISKRIGVDEDGYGVYTVHMRRAVCVAPYKYPIKEWEDHRLCHIVQWPLKLGDTVYTSQGCVKEGDFKRKLEDHIASNISQTKLEDRPGRIARTLSSIYICYDLEKTCQELIDRETVDIVSKTLR